MTRQDIDKIKGYVSAINPSFGTSTSLDVYIDMVSPFVDASYFGDRYHIALAYLVCHRMEMVSRGGDASGAIVSKHEGDIGISYASPTDSNEYSLTSYGRTFLDIEKRCSPGFLLTGGRADITAFGNC